MELNGLRRAMRLLKRAGVPDAADSIRVLIDHCRRHQLEAEFDSLLQRRANREPLQYIIQEWDFHNLPRPLTMRPPMLIPRPETEEFVEFVLQNTPPTKSGTLRVLDIGVGTGAIGLALAHARPVWQVRGIDALPAACALAQENARKMGLLGYSCQATPVIDYKGEEAAQFDVLVSNPPYIPTREMAQLQPEISLHESPLALDGGPDGGNVLRQILARHDLLRAGGSLFLELHHTHTAEWVQAQLKPTRWWTYHQLARDFNGLPRFHWIFKK